MKLLLLLLLAGCATKVPDLMVPGEHYAHELQLEVNGVAYTGVAAVAPAAAYDIKITSPAEEVAFLTVTSCHRQFTTEPPGGTGWLFWKKKQTYAYRYEPMDLEREVGCHVEIGALDKTDGKHGFGFVDFRHPSLALPARLYCNGVEQQGMGLTVCEARAGLEQQIEFDDPVDAVARDGCPEPKLLEPGKYTYEMPSGQCQWAFRDRLGRIHRHVGLGFEKLLYRGK